MKNGIAILFFMCMFSLSAYSQTRVVYGYDNAGNRISRGPYTEKAQASKKTPPKENENTGNGGIAEPDFTVEASRAATADVYNVSVSGLSEGTEGTVSIYSMSGALVHTAPLKDSGNKVSLVSQPLGVYIIEVAADGKRNSVRVVKEK